MKRAKLIKTEFAKESAAALEKETGATEVPQASSGPSKAMLALFAKPAGIDLSKAKRVNMPNMILPKDIPVFTEENQAVLIAEIVKGVNSPASTVKGKCLWIRLPNGDERLLPCTGTIRQGLVPGVEADSPKLLDEINKLKGKKYAFKRLDNRMNSKYKKDMFVFDIFEL